MHELQAREFSRAVRIVHTPEKVITSTHERSSMLLVVLFLALFYGSLYWPSPKVEGPQTTGHMVERLHPV